MSDENFEKEVEAVSSEIEQQPEPVAMEELSSEMQDQVRQLESLAKMDPDFANSQEYQDLMSSINQSEEAGNEEEEYEEEEYEDEEHDEETEQPQEEDVFGVSKSKKRKKDFSVDFEVPDEMIDMISSKFGVEDPSKFFSSVDTWRTQAQEGAEALKEYDALSSDLQSMPFEIKEAIQMWANGDDYTEAFSSNQRLDFSESFRDQDAENLVQHYLEDEYNELVDMYNDDKLDDEDFDDRINLLARTTKRMFNQDAEALENEREKFVQQQREEYKSQKESALLSVKNLGETYPDFSRSEISKIKRVLVDGDLDNIFYNSDGSYKEDAAELLAYAMYGKKMMGAVKSRAEKQGESKANLKTVDSSPKRLRKQKSSDQKRGVNLDAVGHLSSAFKKDPYA
jgi:hypothetical protein